MSAATLPRRTVSEFLAALQFLTRLPVPAWPYEAEALARSVKFFPIIGLIVGACGALLHHFIAPHLPRIVAALITVVFLVCLTGGLHEDGLADVADAFGGGTSREKILLILRDSRIGSYGGMALIVSLVGRMLLITALQPQNVSGYLIAAGVLCRWTPLPLSYFLPAARNEGAHPADGQGARIASRTTIASLIAGSVVSSAIPIVLLRGRAIAPLLASIAITWLTAIYYKRRIGGVTGDCFGATIQITEIGVYLCGAWIL
ncbi:adenosylcobinamide-GDP ribazoletransferase [Terriglobus albidus]|uniref:adenosylcobinamide-GDP ribazoletransferase n=1 Tax=Terriglobus albidus TaxID=1592106 RepID=UPI0021DFFC5E|nr:adenosylcobinamide-GDP ribazoletransferase [Terriglobus albidus]